MSDEVRLEIPQGLSGVGLKELMYQFVSYLATINEFRDGMEFKRDKQKLEVQVVEDMAMQAILQDEELKGLTNPSKKAHLHTYPVFVDNKDGTESRKTNLYQEKKALIERQHKLNRANSRARELQTLIDVCRSGLSFDKSELVSQA